MMKTPMLKLTKIRRFESNVSTLATKRTGRIYEKEKPTEIESDTIVEQKKRKKERITEQTTIKTSIKNTCETRQQKLRKIEWYKAKVVHFQVDKYH